MQRLDSAYALCARMQLRHDPTFFCATRTLPRQVRPAVHALYGFVRTADEVVDGPRRAKDPQRRREQLDAMEHALEEGRARGGSDDPVVAALVDAGARHDLPLDELHVYMRSMRLDCGPVRIASAEELDAYMDGSAAAVGRIMAPLLGAPDEAAEVGRLGVAFQLTNFIRDVRKDWAMDRVYLPGLPERDLATGRPSDDTREEVARQVERARGLFAATDDLPEECDPAVRRGMRLARSVYAGVLDRVERLGFDVLRGRAGLRPWEAARAVIRP